MLRRCVMLLGLSVFSVFGCRVVGFPGAGSVCTMVMAFLAALGWGEDKVRVLAIRTRQCCSQDHLNRDQVMTKTRVYRDRDKTKI